MNSIRSSIAAGSAGLLLIYGCSIVENGGEFLRPFSLTSLDCPTKTAVESDGKTVVWEDGDEISVFDNAGNRRFATEAGGATATFYGTADSETGLLMAYPYDPESAREGDCLSLRVPSTQSGVVGSFGKGANVTMAKVSDEGTFYALNLCAQIRLAVTRTDIISATLSSLDGTPLTGLVLAGFDIGGTPVVKEVRDSVASVTLTSEGGSTLTPGTYFIPVLPFTHAAGVKITLNLASGITASRTVFGGVTLRRSECTDLKADASLSFEKTEERKVVIFGDSITHINVFHHLQSLLDTKSGDLMDGDTLKHISYRVIMAGRSGERPLQIVCRQGGLPLYIKGAFTLDARYFVSTQTGYGLYTTRNEEAENLGTPSFLLNVDYGGESTSGWTGCTNPFVVGGIPCTIKASSVDSSPTGKTLSISRETSGKQDTSFDGEYTLVRTHVDAAYGNPYIATVYMGTNGSYTFENPSDGHTWSQLGDFVQMMMDHAPATKWVVCGYHSKARWTKGGADYLSGRFGDKFLDLKREGIRKVASINAGIGYNLTPQDETYLAGDEWPAGWQDLSNIIHPSEVGHKAYATLLFEKMEELGYI